MQDRPLQTKPRDLIAFDGVSYVGGDTLILQRITLVVRAGAPTILLGPNGAGKSTLLKIAMGLASASAGTIAEFATSDGARPRKAFVFQKPTMLRRSAAANVAFALAAAGRTASTGSVGELLARVGLAALADRPARLLSGGEQQRLALARALARAPDVLFLDEPTASLDPAATQAVEAIIADITNRGVKVVMATHDLGQARRLAGDIVFLVRGEIAEHTPARQFFQEPASVSAARFLAGHLII